MQSKDNGLSKSQDNNYELQKNMMEFKKKVYATINEILLVDN